MRALILAIGLLAGAAGAAHAQLSWRASTAQEQALDAAAFAGFDEGIGSRLTDIRNVVVVLQGRIAYQYHRDGQSDALRDTQSVAKSALAVLVGTAMRQGHIASLDQPVLELVPEWQPLNADPNARAVTLRHLLSMTAGFAVNDPNGTANPLAAPAAWARPMRSRPGASFAYDNSMIPVVRAVLERATGRSLDDYAREQLVKPLEMAEPSYERGLHMRTIDMAKLGQMLLQGGQWGGQALLPPDFTQQLAKPHSSGGPPVSLPYGLAFWVPSDTTYFASGYAGQYIWVHPPMGLVVATSSDVSPAAQQRGQATQLIRGRLFQAVQKRLAAAPQ